MPAAADSPAARVGSRSSGWVGLPILREIRDYRFSRFRADIVAGATVAIVSIPQALGFSLIVGLPPGVVLTTVIIGGFAAALPTRAVRLRTAEAVASVRELARLPSVNADPRELCDRGLGYSISQAIPRFRFDYLNEGGGPWAFVTEMALRSGRGMVEEAAGGTLQEVGWFMPHRTEDGKEII